MRSVVRTQFPPVQLGRPHVPDDLARVVHRMLAPSPESRHATALYAAEALGSVIEDGWGHQPARVLADLVRRASMEQAEDSTLEEGSTRGVARRIEAALVAREES